MTVSIDGTNGITLDGTGTVSTTAGTVYPLVRMTAQNTTSGTVVDFTGIPSWAKRLTVMFSGVSTNGTSVVQIQIGSGSFVTSGYDSSATYGGSASQFLRVTTGFNLEPVGAATAAAFRFGVLQMSLLGSNTWVSVGNIHSGATLQVTSASAGGSPALSGALDRIRITTVNGTDTFDAGVVNVMYEG